jgi:hypothetical protein
MTRSTSSTDRKPLRGILPQPQAAARNLKKLPRISSFSILFFHSFPTVHHLERSTPARLPLCHLERSTPARLPLCHLVRSTPARLPL